MNWLDVILLVLVGLAAVHGLRLGAAMQVLSFGGFWAGLLIGALLTPPVARLVHSTQAKTVVAVVLVFGTAGVVGGVGRLLGARSSVALRKVKLGPIDAGLGVAVAVMATLAAAWVMASVLVNSRFTAMNAAIEHSRIIRAVDSVMPQPPEVFSRVESFLNTEGFPLVFSGLPPQAAGPVTMPTPAELQAAVSQAQASTVKIEGAGCGVIQEGSGFVVAPGLVVTNAHVVAGIHNPRVADGSGDHAAEPIWFDPELDLAVLKVPGLTDRPLRLEGSTVGRGTVGAVLGYPEGGPFDVQPAGIMASFEAQGMDIYGTHQTVRAVYELEALIRPGNSGGPLVTPEGSVVGVVFARSTTDTNEGYALASPAVLGDVQQAERGSGAVVSTGPCTAS